MAELAARPPAHLLLGTPRHGVRVLAEQLADAVDAVQVTDWAAAAQQDRVHLHVNDGLVADSVGALAELARSTRVTLTLHDVPQTSDGGGFGARRDRCRRLLEIADGWAVSSRHEESLVHEHLRPGTDGLVAPLPVLPSPVPPSPILPMQPSTAPCAAAGPHTAAIFGFVYPGKGHQELIAAAAAIRDRAEVTVLALGAVAPGHDDLVHDLSRQARAAGVGFEVTGHLAESVVPQVLSAATVGVCGHRNVSASGSTNQWLAAGRRPLVRDGRYARELAALRPDCYLRYADPDLPDRLLAALADPELTHLAPGTSTRPHLDDTARAYLDWWSGQ